MNQGYTLLWVGWQFDMPDTPNLVYLYPPVVQGIQGIVRAEFTPDRKEARYSVADRNHKPYTVLNPDDPNLRLTVRDQVEGPRTTIPRADWHIENGATIVPKNGFDPGRIYELVYTSENPPVAGTGFAAVRDMVSWLRYGGFVAGAPAPNVALKRAYGFGVSQSGRFLRTMMYFGFNRDDRGRKVFDGLLADVAGGGRGGFNMRFAQPSRDSNPFQNTLTPVDHLPLHGSGTNRPADRHEGRPAHAFASAGVLAQDLLHEFRVRILRPRRFLIHITLDGTGDAKLARVDAHLYVQRRPARARAISAGAARHAEPAEPQPLYLDFPRAAFRHGRLGERRCRAAAFQVSTRGRARTGAARQRAVSQDPRHRLPEDHAPGLSGQLRSGFPHQRASPLRNRRNSASLIR